MNWDKIRENYPAACNQVYLNTAACGLISSQTVAAQNTHFQQYLIEGGNAYQSWTDLVKETREKAAFLLNVDPNDLLFVSNYTAGMNQVAAMWQHKFKKVLLLEGDYPSVILPWKVHAYDCYFFKASENEIISNQVIEDYLKKVRPNILAISHVQFNTGFRLDLKEVASLCKKYGTIFLVDATQSFGAFPIDVQAEDIDVLITSVYKWTTAGYGLGICYINPSLFDNCFPFWAGNNAKGQAIINESFSEVKSKQAAFETGHTNYPAMSALNAALNDLSVLNIESISQRIDSLLSILVEGLKELIEDTPLFHFPKKNRSGILSLDLTPQIQAYLLQEKIITSYRNKGLRISVHFYNNQQDIESIISAFLSSKVF